MKTRGSWARLWGCLGTAIRFQGAAAVGEGKECERRLRCKIPAVRRGPCNQIPWTYLSLPATRLDGHEDEQEHTGKAQRGKRHRVGPAMGGGARQAVTQQHHPA